MKVNKYLLLLTLLISAWTCRAGGWDSVNDITFVDSQNLPSGSSENAIVSTVRSIFTWAIWKPVTNFVNSTVDNAEAIYEKLKNRNECGVCDLSRGDVMIEENWNNGAKVLNKCFSDKCLPYGRNIKRQGCLKQFNMPEDQSIAPNLKICVEAVPGSTADSMPSLRVRSQEVANGARFTTDQVVLAGHGNCKIISSLDIRICARYAANGAPTGSIDPGYTTNFSMNEEGAPVPDTVYIDNNGKLQNTYPLKLCAYVDPASGWNKIGDVNFPFYAISAGIDASGWQDIISDFFDVDPQYQPFHGNAAVDPVIQNIINILNVVKPILGLEGDVINTIFNMIPSYLRSPLESVRWIYNILGGIGQKTIDVVNWGLGYIGTINRVVFDVYDWVINDNQVIVLDGRGDKDQNQSVYLQEGVNFIVDPTIKRVTGLRELRDKDLHSVEISKRQSLGCINVPFGVAPPGYPDVISSSANRELKIYNICTTANDGKRTASTIAGHCVNSPVVNNSIHNAIRIGYDSFLRKCEDDESPETSECIKFRNIPSTELIHTLYNDMLPVCSASSKNPCIETTICSDTKYKDLCPQGFRVLYRSFIPGITGAVDASSYYLEAPGKDNSCDASNVLGCQQLWGINKGNYKDIVLDLRTTQFNPDSASVQPGTALIREQITNLENNLVNNVALVMLNQQFASSDEEGYASEYDKTAQAFVQAYNSLCVYLTDAGNYNLLGCSARLPLPIPQITPCNGACISTHLKPAMQLSLTVGDQADPYTVSAATNITTAADDVKDIMAPVYLAGQQYIAFATNEVYAFPPFIPRTDHTPVSSTLFGKYKDDIYPLVYNPTTQRAEPIADPSKAIYLSDLEYQKGKYLRGATKLCLLQATYQQCPNDSTQCVLAKTVDPLSTAPTASVALGDRAYPKNTLLQLASTDYYDVKKPPVDICDGVDSEIQAQLAQLFPTQGIAKCTQADVNCPAALDITANISVDVCPHRLKILTTCTSTPADQTPGKCYIVTSEINSPQYVLRNKIPGELNMCLDVPPPEGKCAAVTEGNTAWPETSISSGTSAIATGVCLPGYSSMNGAAPLRTCRLDYNLNNTLEVAFEPIDIAKGVGCQYTGPCAKLTAVTDAQLVQTLQTTLPVRDETIVLALPSDTSAFTTPTSDGASPAATQTWTFNLNIPVKANLQTLEIQGYSVTDNGLADNSTLTIALEDTQLSPSTSQNILNLIQEGDNQLTISISTTAIEAGKNLLAIHYKCAT